MYQVKGFKTKEEAEQFKKQNGKGCVLYDKRNTRTGYGTETSQEYKTAIMATGLNPKENPYLVEWRV